MYITMYFSMIIYIELLEGNIYSPFCLIFIRKFLNIRNIKLTSFYVDYELATQ